MKIFKWTVIVLIGAVGAYGAYRWYSSTRPPAYETYTVGRGAVVEEISETGKVVAPEELDLYFKNGGRVATINVQEGDAVLAGELLLQLDTAELQIKAREASALVASAQAKYNQALAGVSLTDLEVYETAVRNAQNSLDQTRQTSTTTIAVSETARDNAYATLKAVLRANVVTVSSALTDMDNILGVDNAVGNDTFENNLGVFNIQTKATAEAAYRETKTVKTEADAAVDLLVSQNSFSQTEAAVPLVYTALNKTVSALEKVKLVLDSSITGTNFSATELSAKKTTIDTARIAVANGITSLTSAKSAVDTARRNLSSAQSQGEAAIVATEGTLKTAQDQLAAKKAPLRAVDKAVYEAAIAQASANLELIDQQIADAALRAPIAGVVTSVDLKPGELATTLTRALALISSDLQIEADVSELDIPKIKIDGVLVVTFEAFGLEEYSGKVLKIAPREKLKDEDIFYKVTMILDTPAPVKPGMTAEIAIKVGEKNEVLVIPERWLIKRAGRTYVKLLENDQPQDREIILGLRGEDVVEVLEGLREGDQIINPAQK